ncbi:MAG: phosphoglycerate kinase [Candidatus Thermoplasmatota archaeon]
MMKAFNTLDDFNVENKTVLLRVDYNMPLDKKTLDITDDTRIRLTLPTIRELIDKKAKTVILAHQGKQGSWDFISLDKHAKTLQKLLGKPVIFVDDTHGEKAKNAIKNLKQGEVLLLDNVRKFPSETDKKTPEEHSKSELVQNLYPLASLFVNDAFAAAHRAQCSLIGFTSVLPSCAGRLMEKELTALEKMVNNPEKPSVFLFGGAKFSDVNATIDHLLKSNTADEILLTGLTANAFLKAIGYNLGDKNEEMFKEEGTPELFNELKNIHTKYKNRIHLPVDFAVEKKGKRAEFRIEDLPVDENIFDIGDKTIEAYINIIRRAKTIFVSGPCGVFENPLFRKGTEKVFKAIADSSAFTIAGGGHTVAAIEQLKLRDKFSHISTGGGALEKYIMGAKLPVIEALKNAKNRTVMTYK